MYMDEVTMHLHSVQTKSFIMKAPCVQKQSKKANSPGLVITRLYFCLGFCSCESHPARQHAFVLGKNKKSTRKKYRVSLSSLHSGHSHRTMPSAYRLQQFTWIDVWILMLANSAHALVRFETPSGETKVWESATFVHYGPQNPKNITGPGFFLEGRMRCDVVKDPEAFYPSLASKVVFVDVQASECGFVHRNDLYKALSKTGPAAAVLTHFISTPPGYFCHSHMTASPFECDFCDHSLVKLDISDPDFDYRLVEGALISIIEPHNHEWEDSYKSIFWIVLNRVCGPLFALWTSSTAVFEFAYPPHTTRTRRDDQIEGAAGRRKYTVADVLWVVETPTLFLVACFLALGQNGPQVLNDVLHTPAASLFSATSACTTALVTIFLLEENRVFAGLGPRRDVLKHYRRRIVLMITIAVFADSGALWYIISDPTLQRALPVMYFFVTVVMLQIPSSVYFFYTVLPTTKSYILTQFLIFKGS